VFLGDGSSKSLQKTFYKQIVSKSFSKKSTKKSQTDLFSIFFNHVFGRFSVRGVQKHDKKFSKKNLTNPRNQPTTSRSVTFFFERPSEISNKSEAPPRTALMKGALSVYSGAAFCCILLCCFEFVRTTALLPPAALRMIL
jgi:hypothetical protein